MRALLAVCLADVLACPGKKPETKNQKRKTKKKTPPDSEGEWTAEVLAFGRLKSLDQVGRHDYPSSLPEIRISYFHTYTLLIFLNNPWPGTSVQYIHIWYVSSITSLTSRIFGLFNLSFKSRITYLLNEKKPTSFLLTVTPTKSFPETGPSPLPALEYSVPSLLV